jgi:hypothetical protein
MLGKETIRAKRKGKGLRVRTAVVVLRHLNREEGYLVPCSGHLEGLQYATL